MEIDPKQILVHALGFLILLAILKKFAWGKLLGAMESRSKRIADELSSIERAKEELEQLKVQYQESLSKIEEAARKKLQEAVQEGRRVAGEIEEDARTYARETLEKAQEAAALEVAKAREALKEQVVDLAIQANHKILERHLDEETDRKMIEAFIQEVNAMGSDRG